MFGANKQMLLHVNSLNWDGKYGINLLKHQRVGIVIVSMLMLAFSSKHLCVQVQHHRAASLAADL